MSRGVVGGGRGQHGEDDVQAEGGEHHVATVRFRQLKIGIKIILILPILTNRVSVHHAFFLYFGPLLVRFSTLKFCQF